MTARTHDAIAFASLVTIATFYPPSSLNLPTVFISIVGNIVGALIPDIDQASNRLWDLLPAGNFLGRVLKRLFLKHRSLTHSILGVYLLYRILDWFLPKILNSGYVDINIIFASIMIGYISHLLADSLTKEGLPLLFPFGIRFGFPPFSALRITTGKWIENFIILPGTAAYLLWFIGRNQNQILTIIRLLTK